MAAGKGKKRNKKKQGGTLAAFSKYADEFLEELGGQMDGTRIEAERQAVKCAGALAELQRQAFSKTLDLVSKVQEGGEDFIDGHLSKAPWLPEEGKEVVREWASMLRAGRSDLGATVDKSYDLLRAYFQRIEQDLPKRAAKKAEKKKTPKKKTRKKKAPKKKAPKKKAPKKKLDAAKKRATEKRA